MAYGTQHPHEVSHTEFELLQLVDLHKVVKNTKLMNLPVIMHMVC